MHDGDAGRCVQHAARSTRGEGPGAVGSSRYARQRDPTSTELGVSSRKLDAISRDLGSIDARRLEQKLPQPVQICLGETRLRGDSIEAPCM